MRIVTTCHKLGLKQYGHRWLQGRKHWPAGTEFVWYAEGYELPLQADELQMVEQAGAGNRNGWIERKDVRDIPEFSEWKMKHARYVPPDWRFDVVKFAHKVFAAYDALHDYDGIGVWLDADCVTFADIPPGLIEKQVEDAYIACYQRTGLYTETGLWIVNCGHPQHRAFMEQLKAIYIGEHYKNLPQYHDCYVLDATIRVFKDRIKVNNLSGEFHRHHHPQAMTELGLYIDHCKGTRKARGASQENAQREAA